MVCFAIHLIDFKFFLLCFYLGFIFLFFEFQFYFFFICIFNSYVYGSSWSRYHTVTATGEGVVVGRLGRDGEEMREEREVEG